MLGRAAGRSVAQGLDGQEVHRGGELRVLELGLVERHGHAHRVDEHAGRLGRVVGVVCEGVAGFDAAQMGDLDGFGGGHC
jgi:hypothetical protein